MTRRLIILAAGCLAAVGALRSADPRANTGIPERVGTTDQFRQLLLATKWTWRNVVAKVPDRECVFMDDGTFRHPNFVARFLIKDMHVVELRRKGGKATLTFDPTYTTFEAVDFDNRRITGRRL